MKSAYRLIQNLSFGGNGESSSLMSDKRIWKGIWQMKVRRKIKIFAWRVSKKILPTLQNLRHKKIDVANICCLCQASGEDVTHALLFCSHVRLLWQYILSLLQQIQHQLTFKETVRFVSERRNEGDFTLFFLEFMVKM